jgi:hypothetical protein
MKSVRSATAIPRFEGGVRRGGQKKGGRTPPHSRTCGARPPARHYNGHFDRIRSTPAGSRAKSQAFSPRTGGTRLAQPYPGVDPIALQVLESTRYSGFIQS